MQFEERIRALSFREEQIGKMLGVTKKVLNWTFEIGGKQRTLSLTYSLFSTTFQVAMDGKLIHEGTRSLLSQFDFATDVCGFKLRIKEGVFTFDCYINDVLFQPGTTLKQVSPQRQSVNHERLHSFGNRMSTRELPSIFDPLPSDRSIIKTTGLTLASQREIGQNTETLMKRKTDPFIDNYLNSGQSRLNDFKSPQLTTKAQSNKATCHSPQNEIQQFTMAKGIRLHRPSGETAKSFKEATAPQALKSDFPCHLQMPAIFTEHAIRTTFKVPRGPPMIFDQFDQYEIDSERFAETDFESHTSLEKRVVQRMFES